MADNGAVQTSQRKDAHEASGRSTDSTPPEQELLSEGPSPTVGIAAECPVGVSASTSRISTSAPTSMADESRIGKESPDSSTRLMSSSDDVIYISDDAVSDVNGASYEPFDETLPPIQAIMQSLED